MVKRKASDCESEDVQQDSKEHVVKKEEDQASPAKSKPKKTKQQNNENVVQSDESDDENTLPCNENVVSPKTTKKSKFFHSSVLTNSDGEHYIELGKKKRATVRSFKGHTLIDIREFYNGQNEDEKPGKKGISLTLEQWNALVNGQSAIDSILTKMKK